MQDITASDLPRADGFLRRSVLRVLAWVQAGMAHLHYGFLDWISQESIPVTCDGEFLEAWAGLKGVVRLGPTPASGTWAGTGTPGTVLPSGTPALRSDGFTYSTTADATVASDNTINAPILADVSGSAGNADVGTPLTLGLTVAGITSNGAVGVQLEGGADTETDESLRSRMLQVYRAPPQGGDQTDYVEWALTVPGVTRAWCNPMGGGAGTVVVYTLFEVTEADHGGFPQGTNGVASDETRDIVATGDQLAVANGIFPKQPVTALVYSYAPVPQAFNLTVAGLDPGGVAMQDDVTAAVVSMLSLMASPLADTPIDQSDVDAAISAVPGVVSFRVTAPTFPQVPAVGSIFVLGTITWT